MHVPNILYDRSRLTLVQGVTNAYHSCDGGGACSISFGSCDGGGACSHSPNACDGGGACASAMMTDLKPPLLESTLLQSNSALKIVPLDHQHHVLVGERGDVPLAVANQTTQKILDFFATPQTLDHWPRANATAYDEIYDTAQDLYLAGFLKPYQINDPTPQHQVPLSDTLEAWLYLTHNCNLSCSHCFVAKDGRKMSPSIGEKAIARLFDLAVKKGYPQIRVKYAGGEPTLNWDLVLRLHQKAKTLSQRTGVSLAEILVTNATLLSPARLQYIRKAGTHLAISVDGYGEGHDRQRPRRDGQRSFQKVLDTIRTAVDMGIKPGLTITLTKLNLSELPAVAQLAIALNLKLNINFYRPVHNQDPLAPNQHNLIQSVLAAFQVYARELPAERFIDGLLDRSYFGFAHQYTCGAGHHYLSVDADGKVYPCHMLAGNHQTEFTTPLELAEPAFPSFDNPPVEARSTCQTCQWRYWCAGGCPALTKTLTGSSNNPSPYCQVYKALYPELLKLEGKRLLKWGNTSNL